jgi:hypothetical protein
MQLTIGSNRQRNTDGSISVRGRRQIHLEWGPFNSELLLTMDLYGHGGKHIARLRRNEWTFNDNTRFDFTANANGFDLVDTKSSHVILGARILGRDSVVITQGTFYSFAGQEIEITVEACKVATDSRPSAEPTAQSTKPRGSSRNTPSSTSDLRM